MAKRKIRVVQYGVGPIGAAIVRLMRTKNALELAGAIDMDPAKVGKDLGELVGADDAPWGIKVYADAAEALGQGVDLVMHCTSSYLKEVAGQLFECIQAGCCVVSTCEELAYPFRKYPEISAKLDAEAKEWGVAVVGTGVNPGFIMDKLVLTAAAAAQRVDSVRVVRQVDAANRREPLQKKIGAGTDPEEFRNQVAAGTLKHHGLPESVAMVADGLGYELDDIIEKIEPVIATARVVTEFLTVEAGQVAGVQQIARGIEDGQDKIHMELKMYVGAGSSIDTIELKGVPSLTLTVPGGTHGDLATAAIAVNAIPVLLEANAGLRTSRDLPMCYFPETAQP
ncbi:MAG TPA: dihydrodipicolinate reductase [Patescibacteria group bacterium]|nr:dihydrodipicolinate reductase [Patescibacteria group bacterium]